MAPPRIRAGLDDGKSETSSIKERSSTTVAATATAGQFLAPTTKGRRYVSNSGSTTALVGASSGKDDHNSSLTSLVVGGAGTMSGGRAGEGIAGASGQEAAVGVSFNPYPLSSCISSLTLDLTDHLVNH